MGILTASRMSTATEVGILTMSVCVWSKHCVLSPRFSTRQAAQASEFNEPLCTLSAVLSWKTNTTAKKMTSQRITTTITTPRH